MTDDDYVKLTIRKGRIKNYKFSCFITRVMIYRCATVFNDRGETKFGKSIKHQKNNTSNISRVMNNVFILL